MVSKDRKSLFSGIRDRHVVRSSALDIFKYIGPGLLVTVGFIDPGNWAANIAAGSQFGYSLLWIVTLSTIMLILLQHNAAHLGIATGLCISEAATKYTPPWISRGILGSAMLAIVATALAEILGASLALQMLFKIPVKVGALMTTILVLVMLFSNSYRKIEKWIIGFVSLIGVSFIYELGIIKVDWPQALLSSVTPTLPEGSMLIVISVLGAVIMPHNLFLHSEIIQSREWNLKDPKVIRKQLDYEFFDTLFSMGIGWAVNSAMIILAAVAFFNNGIRITELAQAHQMLNPLVGSSAAVIFAVALLFAGIASSITAGMAGASIMAGIFGEPYNLKDVHSRLGLALTFGLALLLIFLISDPFMGLIISQVALGIQLPFTVVILIWLTSSKRVMGPFINPVFTRIILLSCAAVVTYLDIRLLTGH